MKEIPLRNEEGEIVAYAKIDDKDFDRVNQFRWCFSGDGRGYAVSSVGIRLQRLVLNLKKGDPGVDHIDHDKLNNQKSNLRLCNQSQNGGNRVKNRTHCGMKTKSKYKGVWKRTDKRKKCWASSIKVNQKRIFLGNFLSEEKAALAYNKGAKKYFGEFALLNEVVAEENPWFG